MSQNTDTKLPAAFAQSIKNYCADKAIHTVANPVDLPEYFERLMDMQGAAFEYFQYNHLEEHIGLLMQWFAKSKFELRDESENWEDKPEFTADSQELGGEFYHLQLLIQTLCRLNNSYQRIKNKFELITPFEKAVK